MKYAEIVSLPVSILSSISYDEFAELLNSCMRQAIIFEAKVNEETDPVAVYQSSIKLHKLNKSLHVLRNHKWYPVYRYNMEKVDSETQNKSRVRKASKLQAAA